MENLIKLYNIQKNLYSFEFEMKRREQLNRIEAWHASCIETNVSTEESVDTSKVSGRKSDKYNVR